MSKRSDLARAVGQNDRLAVERIAAELASCRSLDTLRDVRDKARAIELYQRTRGASLDAQQDAAEIVLRAERRLGELCAETLPHDGGRPSKRSRDVTVSLADLGITKKQSSRWQALARVPEDTFAAHVASVRERRGRLTAAGVIRAANPPQPKPDRPPSEPPSPTEVEDEDEDDSDVWDPDLAAMDLFRAIGAFVDRWPADTTTFPIEAVLHQWLKRLQNRAATKRGDS